MPPKVPKRPGAMPIEPGLVSSASASSSGPVAAPQMPDVGSKRKKRWYENTKGKLRLLRAMNNRQKHQTKNLEAIEHIDFDSAPHVKKEHSVLHEFRTGTKATLMRTTLFLLQVLIRIISYYQPSEDIKVTYGTGWQTAPRMALLFLLENEINAKTWSRLCDVRRMLFTKAIQEGEHTKALTEVLNHEWEADKIREAADALEAVFMQRVVPANLDGRLPALDFNVPLDHQYDGCWKDTDP